METFYCLGGGGCWSAFFQFLSVVLYQLKTWIPEISYSLLNLALSEPGKQR